MSSTGVEQLCVPHSLFWGGSKWPQDWLTSGTGQENKFQGLWDKQPVASFPDTSQAAFSDRSSSATHIMLSLTTVCYFSSEQSPFSDLTLFMCVFVVYSPRLDVQSSRTGPVTVLFMAFLCLAHGWHVLTGWLEGWMSGWLKTLKAGRKEGGKEGRRLSRLISISRWMEKMMDG